MRLFIIVISLCSLVTGAFEKTDRRSKHVRELAVPADVEQLEDRILLFSVTDGWNDSDITYSLVPDGTEYGGTTSQMFLYFDLFTAPTEVWQAEIERAMQTWADAADITITRVDDDGSPQGTFGSAQGDSRFGDLRFGANRMHALGSGAYPQSSGTVGGDITLTTSSTFHIGSAPDLYTISLHNIGHALGMLHSIFSGSAMTSNGFTVLDGLHPDDIAGIQAIYGAPGGGTDPPPPPVPDGDHYEPNDNLLDATDFGKINTLHETGLTIHSTTDVDWYRFEPSRRGTYTISITFSHSTGDLDLTVLDSQGNVLGVGESVTLSLANKSEYSIVVSGDVNDYDLDVIRERGGKGKGGGNSLSAESLALDSYFGTGEVRQAEET